MRYAGGAHLVATAHPHDKYHDSHRYDSDGKGSYPGIDGDEPQQTAQVRGALSIVL